MKHVQTSLAILIVCGLIFGAYVVGSATETHLTLIVERLPKLDSATDAAMALDVAPPKGITITAKGKK